MKRITVARIINHLGYNVMIIDLDAIVLLQLLLKSTALQMLLVLCLVHLILCGDLQCAWEQLSFEALQEQVRWYYEFMIQYHH